MITKDVERVKAVAGKRTSHARVAALRKKPEAAQLAQAAEAAQQWSRLCEQWLAARTEAERTSDNARKTDKWGDALAAGDELFGLLKDEETDTSTWQFVPPSLSAAREERAHVRRLAVKARCSAAVALAELSRAAGDPGRAAETLRGVLLDAREEREYGEAWVARADAFADMLSTSSPLGARVLVEMHLEKAAAVDTDNTQDFEAWRADVDRRAQASDRRPNASSSRQNNPRRAATLCREGDAYMRERFFLSAARKYDDALACLIVDTSRNDDDLRRAVVACHLNLAACHALARAEAALVESHCVAALGLDPDNATALLRRADALQRRGKFQEARVDLARVLDLVRDNSDARGRTQARLDHLAFLEATRNND